MNINITDMENEVIITLCRYILTIFPKDLAKEFNSVPGAKEAFKDDAARLLIKAQINSAGVPPVPCNMTIKQVLFNVDRDNPHVAALASFLEGAIDTLVDIELHVRLVLKDESEYHSSTDLCTMSGIASKTRDFLSMAGFSHNVQYNKD